MLLAIQRFNFVSEVLPIVLVGTLLNIIGRNGCNFAQSHNIIFASQLFLDMIGTGFSSILLGPWWGATVGIFSAIVTGNFYDNYFPFGVVNICGGIAWGYVAAALGVREQLAQEKPNARSFFISFLTLFTAGALACGLASFSVEAVLYPPMGRSFVMGDWYQATRHWLEFLGPRLSTDTSVLLWGEMTREFIDKTITLLIALICVTFYAVPRQQVQSTPFQRIQVDAVSILGFVGVYGIYLCFGRVFKPRIMFTGGEHSVDWLTYPPIIGLLYFPLVLAVLVFCFGTLDQNSIYSRRIEAFRLRRQFLVTLFLADKGWQFLEGEINSRWTEAKKLYGLMAGVLTWPLTKLAGVPDLNTGLTYAGGALALVGYYFYQNNQIVTIYQKFHSSIKSLQDWFSIRNTSDSKGSNTILQQLTHQFGGAAGPTFHDPSLLYVTAETTKLDTTGARSGRSERRSTIIVALCGGNAILTTKAREQLQRAIDAIRPNVVWLLCGNAGDPGFLSWIGENLRTGTELYLVDWSLSEELMETMGRPSRLTQFLGKLRVSMKAGLAAGAQHIEQLDRVVNIGLAARTLPALAYVLDRIPRGQLVLDLGSGRGRHTLYALRSGLRVVAVEKNEKAFVDMIGHVKVGASPIPVLRFWVIIRKLICSNLVRRV